MVTGLGKRTIDILTMRHGDHPPHPAIFITCQWQKHGGVNLLYLWYRWFVAVFVLSVALGSFLAPERGTLASGGNAPPVVYWKWFIYLTNWGFTLVVFHTVLSLILLQTAFIERRTREHKIDTLFTDVELSLTVVKENIAHDMEDDSICRSQTASSKDRCLGTALRIIHAAATDLAFLITTVYWSLIYDPKIHVIDAVNVLVHGCNSLIMFTELWLVRHISLPLDAIGALIVATVYVIFSGIYYTAGGTDRHERSYIYPALDWSQVGRSFVFCVGCAGGIIAAHILLLIIQAARRALHNKRVVKRSSYSVSG